MRTTTTIIAISFLIVLAANQTFFQSGSIKPANISGDTSVTFTRTYEDSAPYFGLALTQLLDTYSPNSIYRLQISVVSVLKTGFTIGWNYSSGSSFSQSYSWIASNEHPLITSTFLLNNIAQGNHTLDLTQARRAIPPSFYSLTLYVDFLIYGFVINSAAKFQLNVAPIKLQPLTYVDNARLNYANASSCSPWISQNNINYSVQIGG